MEKIHSYQSLSLLLPQMKSVKVIGITLFLATKDLLRPEHGTFKGKALANIT